MATDQNILEVNNLSKYFGGLAAVSDCSLKIKKGSITGIIGPNGSGKTTLFNLIAGNLKSSAGNVMFNNENITDVPSYELFSKGLLRTFQIAHEFTNLSVLENLMMVPGNQSGEKIMTALFKSGLVAQEEAVVKEKAKEVVEFLNLGHLSNELAGNLSGGQKKLLELGRTMMVDARIVLLDEVGAGVNRTLLKDLCLLKVNQYSIQLKQIKYSETLVFIKNSLQIVYGGLGIGWIGDLEGSGAESDMETLAVVLGGKERWVGRFEDNMDGAKEFLDLMEIVYTAMESILKAVDIKSLDSGDLQVPAEIDSMYDKFNSDFVSNKANGQRSLQSYMVDSLGIPSQWYSSASGTSIMTMLVKNILFKV